MLAPVTSKPSLLSRGSVPATSPAPAAMEQRLPDGSPDAFQEAEATAQAPRPKLDRPVLFFNEYCEVCTAIATWVSKEDLGAGDRLDERPIPAYQEDLDAIAPGLNLNDVFAVSHLLMPDGRVLTGGEAVAEVLKVLPKTRWFAGLFDVRLGDSRPFLVALGTAYKLLDQVRPALGCTSCGPNAVPRWALPVKWAADAFKGGRGLLERLSA